jgi:RNA polymerase sigma factor (sigma-70 family)
LLLEPGFRPERPVTAADEGRIDPAVVAALYLEHADALRRFLVGLVGDSQLAGDLLQATFAKAVERGHTAREESRKAWLFRVAFHEAMAVLRRRSIGERAVRRVAWSRHNESGAVDEPVLRFEVVEAVREAIDELPADQRRVVQMRIYEDKTFALIARELNIPLGTALGRMRAALAKLRRKLEDRNLS